MEALRERRDRAPTHSRPRHYLGVSDQRHAPAALYTRGKDPPGAGGWVGPRAGLDTKAGGNILSSLRGIEPPSPGRPVRSQTLY
jgi:hypothetical protein